MKKNILALVFLLSSVFSFAQYRTSYQKTNPSQLGTVLANDFFVGHWTVHASVGAVWSFPSNTSITVTGGNDDLSNFVVNEQYNVALDNCVLTADITCNDAVPSITSDGFMVGFEAWNYASVVGNDMFQLSPSAGKCRAWTYDTQISSISGQPAAPNFPAPIHNDVVRIRVTRNYNVTTFECWNLTNGVDYCTYNYTHTLTYPLGSYSSLGMTKVCFWSVKGGFTVNSFSLTSTERKNIRTLCVGDSKSYGKGVVNVANRYGALGVFGGIRQYSANGGDRTDNVLARIDQLIAYKPRYVILWIGCNDVAEGIAPATYQANYASIVSQLQAAHITVYHLLSAPESRASQATLNNWIIATYPGFYIDVYTPLLGTGTLLNSLFDCGDGIHENPKGDSVVNARVKIAFPFLL